MPSAVSKADELSDLVSNSPNRIHGAVTPSFAMVIVAFFLEVADALDAFVERARFEWVLRIGTKPCPPNF